MPLSQEEADRLAKICFADDVASPVTKEEIANLWGGMGRIYRITVHDGGKNNSFIIKYIDHASRGCRLPMSDKHKLIESYENEAKFYQQDSETLRQKHHGIIIPKSYHVESQTSKTIICMSLLQNDPSAMSLSDLRYKTMEWLASFHAATWQRPSEQIGCYWHYETRPKAWKILKSHGLEGRLKQASKPLDDWLHSSTNLQCWIHGDCKVDNVMWDESSNRIALCDFQYVGRGCPCQDLIYFLTDSSAGGGGCDDDEKLHDSLIDHYYETLSSKLSSLIATTISRKELDVAIDISYCDYLRFLCAWRGQHRKQKELVIPRVENIMNEIDSGFDLGSEQAYRDAIETYVETNCGGC